MKSRLVLAVALMSLCELAVADDAGPFVYGSIGVARADFNGESADDSRVSQENGGASVVSSVKNTPMAYGLNLGYQLGTSLGFQVGYISTGSIKYSTSVPVLAQASEKLQIWDALISGSHDVGAGFAVMFRGGIANLRAIGSGTIVHLGGRATRAAGGAGIKYAIDSHVSVRLDWDGFQGPGGSQIGQVNFFSAGIGYRF